MDEDFKFQLDVFNTPTNDSYQKELSRTTKRIAKISGLNEIGERLGVLKMVLLISSDDFEASVKHLNDERKEIGLKIRSLKKETIKDSTQRRLITEKIGKLEKDRDKIIESIMNAPAKENYLKRKKLLEERIEKYHEQIYRFCLDFVEDVNKDLTPIKEKKGFSEFYLDYDLTFTILKKEKHQVVVDGKVHTANIKAYKFEQLDRETKVEVLKTIKANFKKEYLKDDTEE